MRDTRGLLLLVLSWVIALGITTSAWAIAWFLVVRFVAEVVAVFVAAADRAIRYR